MTHPSPPQAASARVIPAPQQAPDNLDFWAGTATGVLRLRHCTDCARPHWYPRPQCPLCMGPQTVWKDAGGLGSIYSFSICRRVGPVPYVIAYVRLDEGITMLSNIVDCDPEALRIGDRVRVVMRLSDDGVTQVPMFTPVTGA